MLRLLFPRNALTDKAQKDVASVPREFVTLSVSTSSWAHWLPNQEPSSNCRILRCSTISASKSINALPSRHALGELNISRPSHEEPITLAGSARVTSRRGEGTVVSFLRLRSDRSLRSWRELQKSREDGAMQRAASAVISLRQRAGTAASSS